MVPWIGIPLNAVLKQAEPNSKAKYVAFQSYYDPRPNAGGAVGRNPVAVCGGSAPGRSHASADAAGGGHLRRDVAESGRRAGASGCALEIRFQEHQVDREDQARGEAAAHHLEHRDSNEYGFYSNVNPEVDHPALEPGERAAPGRVLQARHAEVQRLRRPGGLAIHRHGPAKELLTDAQLRSLGQSFAAVSGALSLARLAGGSTRTWAPIRSSSSRTPPATGRYAFSFTLAVTPRANCWACRS